MGPLPAVSLPGMLKLLHVTRREIAGWITSNMPSPGFCFSWSILVIMQRLKEFHKHLAYKPRPFSYKGCLRKG